MTKWIVIAASVVLLITGSAYAKDYEVKKKAGDYDVTVKIDRNPPVVGDNNMEIEIKDAKGGHITDANVVVEYSMPAMPGMPPMNYKADARPDGNEYKAKMNLSMTGPWNIVVKISKGDKISRVKFSVDAQ